MSLLLLRVLLPWAPLVLVPSPAAAIPTLPLGIAAPATAATGRTAVVRATLIRAGDAGLRTHPVRACDLRHAHLLLLLQDLLETPHPFASRRVGLQLPKLLPLAVHFQLALQVGLRRVVCPPLRNVRPHLLRRLQRGRRRLRLGSKRALPCRIEMFLFPVIFEHFGDSRESAAFVAADFVHAEVGLELIPVLEGLLAGFALLR
mmetsp:Transcript_944/g.2609  ORF Transcript_944/g.2609 Transcript_944/m.2609 type:complete len:203 (-) Transcript_944:43-651(-)